MQPLGPCECLTLRFADVWDAVAEERSQPLDRSWSYVDCEDRTSSTMALDGGSRSAPLPTAVRRRWRSTRSSRFPSASPPTSCARSTARSSPCCTATTATPTSTTRTAASCRTRCSRSGARRATRSPSEERTATQRVGQHLRVRAAVRHARPRGRHAAGVRALRADPAGALVSELLPSRQAAQHPDEPRRLPDDDVRAVRRGGAARTRRVPSRPRRRHLPRPVCACPRAVPCRRRRVARRARTGTRVTRRTATRPRRSGASARRTSASSPTEP